MRKSTKVLSFFLILIFVSPLIIDMIFPGLIHPSPNLCPETEPICDENGLCTPAVPLACIDKGQIGGPVPDNPVDYLSNLTAPFILVSVFDAILAGSYFGILSLYKVAKKLFKR